jgi:hypothetical protein
MPTDHEVPVRDESEKNATPAPTVDSHRGHFQQYVGTYVQRACNDQEAQSAHQELDFSSHSTQIEMLIQVNLSTTNVELFHIA